MTEQLATFIRNYWPLVAALVAVAVAWGASTAQLSALAGNVERVLKKQDELASSLTTLGNAVAADGAKGDAAMASIADLRIRMNAIEAKR